MPGGVRGVSRAASMHYVGQGFEIRVELPDDITDVEAMREAFFARYRQEYGYVDRETPIEVTDWAAVATISAAPTSLLALPLREGSGRSASTRLAYFPEAGGMVETPVFDRSSMGSGTPLQGPLLIEEPECTTLVLPGDSVSATPHGNLIIDIGGAR